MEENKNNYEDNQMKILADKCDEVEEQLTQEEMNMNFSKMEKLDLGDHKNYKTRLVQNRW